LIYNLGERVTKEAGRVGSLSSALADILSKIISVSGFQTLAGSPNQLGKLLEALISAWLEEWRNQPNKSSYLRRAFRTSVVLRRFLQVVLYVGTLLLLGLVGFVSLAFFMDKHSWTWNLWFWILVTSLVVSSLPLISRVLLRTQPGLGIVLELATLSIVLTVFATRLLHLPVLHLWTMSAVLLILLLGAGGRSVEMLHGQTEHELQTEWKGPPANPPTNGPSEDEVNVQLISIRQYFFQELTVYSALPAGVFTGLFFFLLWGRWWAFTSVTIVSVCLGCVFGLAGLLLLYFLVVSFRRMIHPTLCLEHPPDLSTGTPAALDWGCVMTAYRKMFLLDAIDNLVLLVAFCLLEWFLWGGRELSARDPKIIAIGIAATIMLNEIPYLIGQWRVHELLSTPYKGWSRITKMREAAENIPLLIGA
jgi:hypothetical protein